MKQAVFYTNNGPSIYDNQDSILIGDDIYNHMSLDKPEEMLNPKTSLFAVADGVSSSNKPHIASGLALEYLLECLNKNEYFSYKKTAEYIQDKMENYAISHIDEKNSSSTLAGIYVEDQKLTIFNTGDSRIYRLKKDSLKQLSQDHTQKNGMLNRGEISFEEMQELSDIYNMLEGYFVVGELDDEELLTYSDIFRVEEEDMFLICTDGVHDSLSDKEIQQILSQDTPLIDKATILAQNAKEKELDNLSFILLLF